MKRFVLRKPSLQDKDVKKDDSFVINGINKSNLSKIKKSVKDDIKKIFLDEFEYIKKHGGSVNYRRKNLNKIQNEIFTVLKERI